MSAAHANRVADAVLAIAYEPEAEVCLRRRASNNVNLSGLAPSQGKAALWELYLGSGYKLEEFPRRVFGHC